jgi:N-acetylglucosaminyl-diphospho-decaprenol L-rhamnosyltransferase
VNAPGSDRPVDVIVVTFNSEPVVGGLLDSLDRGLDGVDWRLEVVDNGSTDRTVELVRERRPGTGILALGANHGYGAAINRALGRTRPDSDLLILNPDVRLGPDAARKLQARLRLPASTGTTDGTAGQPVGIVAPRVVDGAGSLQPTLRFEPSVGRALAETVLGASRAGRRGWGEAILDPALYDRPTVAAWASGAALMISRECLDACGEWDQSFFLYAEETEYALRARDRGLLTVLEPEADATHLGGESRTDARLWSLLVTNKVALYGRRHGRLGAIAFRAASVLRELRYAATGNRPSLGAARALLSGRPR